MHAIIFLLKLLSAAPEIAQAMLIQICNAMHKLAANINAHDMMITTKLVMSSKHE